MIWVDYAIIGTILVSTFISLIRGFVREALSLAGWIASFLVAKMFGGGFAELFLTSIKDDTARLLVAFVILFVVSLVLCAVANYFIAQLVKRTGLTGTDRFIGLFFGFLRGVLMIAVLAILATALGLNKEAWWKDSALIFRFEAIGEWLKTLFV